MATNWDLAARVTEMRPAFDMVADPANWKLPINAVVEIRSIYDLLLLQDAIAWYTGSRATFTPLRAGALPGCRYQVEAAGYYAAIGA